ncbi:MAG: hypothetical protein WCL08_00225 [Verrucomicrobiota bacterium]
MKITFRNIHSNNTLEVRNDGIAVNYFKVTADYITGLRRVLKRAIEVKDTDPVGSFMSPEEVERAVAAHWALTVQIPIWEEQILFLAAEFPRQFRASLKKDPNPTY